MQLDLIFQASRDEIRTGSGSGRPGAQLSSEELLFNIPTNAVATAPGSDFLLIILLEFATRRLIRKIEDCITTQK
jgi:hypothetical protein